MPLHQEGAGRFGHFWTLAVEEQFYIFWSWLLLFTPRRYLRNVLVVVIAVAPLYQLFWSDGAEGFGWGMLPFSSLDTLAVGALAALMRHRSPDRERWRRRMCRIALPVGTVAYFGLHAAGYYAGADRLVTTVHEIAFGVASAGLIAAATTGIRGPVGRVLELKPLVYLGKISYGIYVYHLFMPWGLAKIYGRLGFEFHDNGAMRFLVAGAATVVVSALSWHLFEKPINDRKRLFPYIPAQEKTVEAPE